MYSSPALLEEPMKTSEEWLAASTRVISLFSAPRTQDLLVPTGIGNQRSRFTK
jgi:hypothetical protein